MAFSITKNPHFKKRFCVFLWQIDVEICQIFMSLIFSKILV